MHHWPQRGVLHLLFGIEEGGQVWLHYVAPSLSVFRNDNRRFETRDERNRLFPTGRIPYKCKQNNWNDHFWLAMIEKEIN